MYTPLPHKPFYMIRHGQTVANAAEVLAGSTDSPLTDIGRAQAHGAQKIVAQLQTPPKIIIHSHLRRARNTAIIINAPLNAPIYEDNRYGEMCAGDWEGKPYSDCEEIFRDWVEAPNGETIDQFFGRIHATKYDALSAHDAPVLFVGHGGVFRAFFKIYDLDLPPVDNCTVFGFTPKNHTQGHFPWDVVQYTVDNDNNLNAASVLF